MNENNRKTNLWRPNSYISAKSYLVVSGITFFNTINMCDRGRTITHMQIPRFHTQVWYNCRYSPQNIFNAKNFNPHKKPISLLNVPVCTQGMQQTWWPEAGTIIVTGPYFLDSFSDWWYVLWNCHQVIVIGLTDDNSIFVVLVMAWCHQATSHYWSQCWSRSVPPYGVTGPERFTSLWRYMATETRVNIGSGNGLLPDGTKPLPEPMLTYYQ